MIDLQVQIHVPDSDAPRVISTVGTMANLVNEVLQAAVGNHFRDKLQGMPAIDFIQKRADVQAAGARAHHRAPAGLSGRDARRLHPGRGVSGAVGRKC